MPPRSSFGGSFFGQPVKLNQPGAPLGRAMEVPPPGQPMATQPARYAPRVGGSVKTPGGTAQAPAPMKAPAASFPPKHIPMGNKGDCPICH